MSDEFNIEDIGFIVIVALLGLFVCGITYKLIITKNNFEKLEIKDDEYKLVAYQYSRIEELKPVIAKTMADQKITREEYKEIIRMYQQINRQKLQKDILHSVEKAEK